MGSMEIDRVRQLTEEGASARDIAYAAAGIPQEFWDITRADIRLPKQDKVFLQVYEFVKAYVDDIHTMIGDGRGLTLFGDPKSGKTMFGCAILRSAAYDAEKNNRPYKVWRGNYDTIIEDLYHLRGEAEFGDYRNTMCRYDVLFVDSISPTTPPSSLLSILRTRRDFRKATFLASSVSVDGAKKCRIMELCDIFADVNRIYVIQKVQDGN